MLRKRWIKEKRERVEKGANRREKRKSEEKGGREDKRE